ncbi:hypothetical protein [Croceivirga sp. JEA036]|uniref:hypothetical protein n=1 Tax=Croceivirga sp. JEA036 TaxID=2721162 RepID=UPI00143B38FA|nr:hypothetical protein [Croceivirga sp. JEA036]NJB36535.1 hypothetical protein [Croceivirga sp. JEA036]
MFDNFLIAPFRLIFLLLGLLVIHQFAVRQHLQNYTYSYFVRRTAIYGAALLLGMFVLVQLNMYSTFSIILLLFGISFYKYFRIGSLIGEQGKEKELRRRMLIGFFVLLEKRQFSFKHFWEKGIKEIMPKTFHKPTILVLSIGLLAIVMRFAYVDTDTYTLSSAWLESLKIVKNFDANNWLVDDYRIVGEHAFINVYAKLTGISKEMALYTFGLIEIFLLCTAIFYALAAFTGSKWKIPFFGTMLFATIFYVLPVNTNIVMENSPVDLALFFAITFLIFLLKPSEISVFRKKYFLIQFLLVSAVALINFYVLFMLMPLFLIVALVNYKQEKKYIRKSLLAYLAATIILVGVKIVSCYVHKIDVFSFFTSNILSIQSYSYFPTLLIDFNVLLIIYQIVLWISFLVLLFLKIRNNKYNASFGFTLLFLILFHVNIFGFLWLDVDLFYKTLAVLFPIQIAIGIHAVVCFIDTNFSRVSLWFKLKKNGTVTAMGLVILATILIQPSYSNDKTTGDLKKELVMLYDALYRNQFQNSFMVVNNFYGYQLSENEHLFMSHAEFVKDYLDRDAVYFKKINQGLKEQMLPEEIVPESVFVIFTKQKNKEDAHFTIGSKQQEQSYQVLETLKQKGRRLRVYGETENLKVVEIVNANNLSNINEMIFNYEKGF